MIDPSEVVALVAYVGSSQTAAITGAALRVEVRDCFYAQLNEFLEGKQP